MTFYDSFGSNVSSSLSKQGRTLPGKVFLPLATFAHPSSEKENNLKRQFSNLLSFA
jgi:hypothetical protein